MSNPLHPFIFLLNNHNYYDCNIFLVCLHIFTKNVDKKFFLFSLKSIIKKKYNLD